MQDTLFHKMNLVEDYMPVIRAKVNSSWNLHTLLRDVDLDFFILMASTSGIIGRESQAAYAAASTFQDALASHRNSLGLCAVALDLTFITGLDYEAHDYELLNSLLRIGVRPISIDEVCAIIKAVILNAARGCNRGQVVTGIYADDPETEIYTAEVALCTHTRRLAMMEAVDVGAGAAEGGERERNAIRNAGTFDEAASLIEMCIIAKLSGLLMIPMEEISASRVVADYGLDSLVSRTLSPCVGVAQCCRSIDHQVQLLTARAQVAVELRNWCTKHLMATLSILELLANESITILARKVARKSKLVRPELLEESAPVEEKSE